MKNSKFVTLYETVYNRYKQGSGFLEGDVVKLKSDYKSTEGYKSLADSVKQRVDDAANSGYNLRLGRLHSPHNQYGSYGHLNLPATHADMYEEKSPGNFGNLVTVPLDMLEEVDTGVNLPPVSKNNKRTGAEAPYQKPGKWKSNKDTPETKDQNHMGHEQNWAPKGDYDLASKNKKPSVGGNKYDDNKPSKFKALPVRESLEDLYQKLITEDAQEDGDQNVEITTGEDIAKADDIAAMENMAVAAPEITEANIKPECWDKTKNTVVDECWGDDGKVKPECWQGEEMAEDTAPGLAQGGNLVAPEEREQTSSL